MQNQTAHINLKMNSLKQHS